MLSSYKSSRSLSHLLMSSCTCLVQACPACPGKEAIKSVCLSECNVSQGGLAMCLNVLRSFYFTANLEVSVVV